MIEIANIWLPIIGSILLGGVAVGAWYGGNKVAALWLAFGGVVCLLLLGALQIQQVLTKAEAKGDLPDRPWVSIFRMDIAPIQVGDFRFIIRFKNTGQSPALDTRVIVNWLIANTDEPPPEIPTAIPAGVSTIIILPGDDPPMDTIGKGVLTPEIVADIESGRRTIWVAGRLEYRDRAQTLHLTTFRAAYVPASNRFQSTDTHAD